MHNTSKIGLGSVQWGTSYGISNDHGITDLSEVRKILEISESEKINLIDTASLYGEAEIKLGNFNLLNFKIVTKTPKLDSKIITSEEIFNLEKTFQKSLKNLNLNKIYGLLIHDADDLLKKGGNLIVQKLIDFKEKGLVKKIGVSIYDYRIMEKILEFFTPDIVQLPLNIFDQESYFSGALSSWKSKNIEIHARSIFLQGLIFLDLDNMPEYFHPWKNYFSNFNRICSKNNLSKLEVALNFISNINEVDNFILGFNNSAQLLDCLKAIKIKNEIDFSKLAISDSNLINPQNWKL